MKTWLRAMVLVVMLPSLAAAQGNPELFGAWALDAAKSDPVPAARGATPAAGAARTPAATPPAARVTIGSTADGVSIALGALTIAFKLDGTEAFWFQGGENRGTAAWDGGALVVSWKREFYAGPRQGYVTYSGKDVYRVAGNILTVEKTTTGPDASDTKKFVYNKS
jgi:hypothetical protein